MNCIVMIYKLLISLAALSTRRARAKRGVPFFTSFIWYSALVCLTLNMVGCTRHRQNVKTSFFLLLSALICLTLTGSKLGGGSEKCKQVCFFAHLALTLN